MDVPSFAVLMTPVDGLADRTAYLWNLTSTVNFQPSYILNTLAGAVTASVCAFDPITLKWLTSNG